VSVVNSSPCCWYSSTVWNEFCLLLTLPANAGQDDNSNDCIYTQDRGQRKNILKRRYESTTRSEYGLLHCDRWWQQSFRHCSLSFWNVTATKNNWVSETACTIPRKQTVPPLTIPPRIFPLPCSVRVRVTSGVSTVRVRVGGSVGLELVGLVLGLELGLGLWFELRGNVREGKCPGGCATLLFPTCRPNLTLKSL